MNFKISAKTHKELLLTLFDIINDEYERASSLETDDLEMVFPKLVVMYEFYRLMRGEAFTDILEPIGDFQKEIYMMEDLLGEKLNNIKARLGDTERARFYVDNMKKSFDI